MTWNGENNTESVRYEMKKKLQYLRELLGVHCCGIFYQEITSDLRVKAIIIIIIIVIIITIIIIVELI